MQIKIKTFSLIFAIWAGLLLGGNVFADGANAQAAGNQTISAQIDQVKQKIDMLAAQLEAKKIASAAPKKANLSQAELDRIEKEVKRIAKETERLAIEVKVFVTLRDIQKKTSDLAKLMPSNQTAVSTAKTPAPVQGTAISASKQAEIEKQIDKVKQQIAELTQEMNAQKSGQAAVAQIQESAAQEECSGPTCKIEEGQESAQKITIAPAEQKPQETKPAEQKNFWQSVGDFLKKIFTF